MTRLFITPVVPSCIIDTLARAVLSMLHFSMPPQARLLAALARLGAPQPHRVLQPITDLRHLQTLQAAACQCAAAARVFQDELPAAAPPGSSQEAAPHSDRRALLAKVRASLPRGLPCVVAIVSAHTAASEDWQQLDTAYQGTTLGDCPYASKCGRTSSHSAAGAGSLPAHHRPFLQAPNQPLCSQLAGRALQASKKRRLDELCAERFPQHSRNVVQSWIAQGKVSVNTRVVLKAGAPVAPDANIVINADVPKFVCRYHPRCPAFCGNWLVVTAASKLLPA